MTDRELRRLSRKDLLELLISQGCERDALQAELERIKAELENRQLCMEQAGSIAEAALRLNGVFEAAQAAAQQYLDSVRQRSEDIEEICAKREADCVRRETECQENIEKQLREAAETARRLEEETRAKCQKLEEDAEKKSEAYWAEVSARLDSFCKEHEELKQMLFSGGKT